MLFLINKPKNLKKKVITIEIRVLRYFLETAREGSMTKAAERLHVTQPTLSKQIKELELELGKKLLLQVVCNVNLINNGLVFTRENVALLLGFEGIVETTEDTSITFRPLSPSLTTNMYVIWKKYQVFTPIANLLLDELKNEFA